MCACSGTSNTGLAAHRAAVDLQQEGLGRLLCCTAVANCDEAMLRAGKNAERVVGIDGCSAACAKKSLEQAGISVTDYVVATNLGLKKEPLEGSPDTKSVARIKNAVKARLATIAGGPFCS